MIQAKLRPSLHPHLHLFDRRSPVVAARMVDGDRRWDRLLGRDEEILGKTHRLIMIDRGDVVRAILRHVDRSVIRVVRAACQFDLLAAVKLQHAIFQRRGHRDC